VPALRLHAPRLRFRHPRLWLIPPALVVLNVLAAQLLAPLDPAPPQVPYTYFKEQVQAGNVAEITTRGDDIVGTFLDPVAWPPNGPTPARVSTFRTRAPSFPDAGLIPLVEARHVVVNARALDEGRPWWTGILLSIAPALIVSGLLIWMITRLTPGRGLGRARPRRYVGEESTRVTFANVAGIDEARQELVEIVDFLRSPDRYRRVGASIPRGVLLVGPPGTGKTLLARAVAGEAGVPFFSMSGSEFVEMVVGVGASRVRDLFAQARRAAPAIVFVDEIDAIGRARGTLVGPGEREQTLNQLLVEMDGFDAGDAVIVLAATNRLDVLDPALLRPGRFDRHVTVQRPDRAGRQKILEVHTRGVPLADDVSLSDLAAATPGLVGAELRNVVNEAALLAARNGREVVRTDDLFEALERLVLGVARNVVLLPEDRLRVAYHEAGHALIGLVLPEADPVQKVTIVPRGDALGVTYQVPVDDRHNVTREYLVARLVGALGGRAAEELVFGNVTTGAQNDLRQATALARRMTTQWGMSDDFGLLSLDGLGGDEAVGLEVTPGRRVSELTARRAERAIARLVDACHAEARAILARERARLDALAEALLERESLGEAEIFEVLHPISAAPRRDAAKNGGVADAIVTNNDGEYDPRTRG